MLRSLSFRRAPALLLAAALIATGFTSCDTAKSVGSAAAKPFKAVGSAAGKTAKKANPMRLFKRDKKKDGDVPEDIQAELADAKPEDPNAKPAAVQWPSQNTVTPGAQPTPGTANTSTRSSLTLPSRPTTDLPPLPTRPSTPPVTTPQPQPTPSTPPSTVSTFEEPPSLDVPPLSDPTRDREPLATPTLSDDGFIQLTPKLPSEESLLPPE